MYSPSLGTSTPQSTWRWTTSLTALGMRWRTAGVSWRARRSFRSSGRGTRPFSQQVAGGRAAVGREPHVADGHVQLDLIESVAGGLPNAAHLVLHSCQRDIGHVDPTIRTRASRNADDVSQASRNGKY